MPGDSCAPAITPTTFAPRSSIAGCMTEMTMVDTTMHLMQLAAGPVLASDAPMFPLLENLEGGYHAARERYFADAPKVAGVLNRRLLVDSFQSFEDFVRDCLRVLYFAFPYFIYGLKDGRDLPDVGVDDLFSAASLPEARAAVVARRVSAFLQADNIGTVLQKAEQRLTVSVGLQPSDLNALVELSAIRNALTHSQGLVTERFLGLLRRHKVTHGYELNAVLTVDRPRAEAARTLVDRLASQVAGALTKAVPHLQSYHRGLASGVGV